MITEERVHKNFDFLNENSLKGAEARANRLYLEAFEKHLIAKLKADSNEKTDAAKTTHALQHPDYLIHLEGYKEAVKRDEWYRWKKESLLAECEVFRTLESSKKTLVRAAT